jgi:hypothetical protein
LECGRKYSFFEIPSIGTVAVLDSLKNWLISGPAVVVVFLFFSILLNQQYFNICRWAFDSATTPLLVTGRAILFLHTAQKNMYSVPDCDF